MQKERIEKLKAQKRLTKTQSGKGTTAKKTITTKRTPAKKTTTASTSQTKATPKKTTKKEEEK